MTPDPSGHRRRRTTAARAALGPERDRGNGGSMTKRRHHGYRALVAGLASAVALCETLPSPLAVALACHPWILLHVV